MASRGMIVVVIAFLLLSMPVLGCFASSSPSTTSSTCSPSSSSATTTAVSISFNATTAVRFYSSLMSPLGLFTDYLGSHTIWLADDQALDYCALLSVYNSTHNSIALNLAQQVNSSIVKWGGFYKYWNPVFEVLGNYPENVNETIPWCGKSQEIGVTQGYTVNATVFKPCRGFEYWLFADLLAYHVLLDMHFGNDTGAELEFSELSSIWNGHGFYDQPFQEDPTYTYQSYKLADYVIAWEALASNSATRQFALGYQTRVQSVAAVMSELQSSAGGVWTGYIVSNGQISYGNGISLTNGETTSLFIFALVGPPNSTPPSTSTSSGGGIPEFPIQFGFTLLVTVAIVTSYVFARCNLRNGKRPPA